MRHIFIFFILLSGCNGEQDVQLDTQANYKASDLVLKQSQVSLTGTALKKSLEWNEYQAFVTALENFDHSKESAQLLLESTAEMVENPDLDFNSAPITSRARILQTRVGIFSSFLGYTVKTSQIHQSKYDDIIIAWDELKNRMNFKFNEIDGTREELLKQLRNEKRIDAERERRDSIAAIAL